MKIFLHIGKARTSTTALQNGAARQRDILRKAGLCYPATAPHDARHMPLFWSAAAAHLEKLHPWHIHSYDGLPLEARIAATMMQAEGCKAVLLSSEWFSIAVPDQTFAPLVQQLARYGDVTAVVTLRDQADATLSAWARRIMDRTPMPGLPAMTARMADWDKPAHPLNHYQLLRNWSSFCDVIALPYGPDAPERVMAAIGYAGLITFQRESASVRLDLCDHLRRRIAEPLSPTDWRALVTRLSEAPDRFAAFSRHEVFSEAAELTARIREAYARSNIRVQQEFSHLFR